MASGRRTDEQHRFGCSRLLFGANLTGLVREPRHRRSQLGQADVFLNPDMPHADGTVKGEAGLEHGWRSVSGLHDAEAVIEIVPFPVNLTMPDHVIHPVVGN